jgi:hypothetical protein
MNDDRDVDKKIILLPEKGTTRTVASKGTSIDVIKSLYIASGMNVEEIAEETFLPVERIKQLIQDHKLPELRKAYIIEGVQKIQNTQLQQTHKLMDLENNFKRMRIIQLEAELENYLAYYSRHGDFYKRHPSTGEILKDMNGVPIQIKLPNVSRELVQLKESVTLSEGVRTMLHRLDEIINTSKPAESAEDPDTFDVTDYNQLFESSDD